MGKTNQENMRGSSAVPQLTCQRSKVRAKHFHSCGICSGMPGLAIRPSDHLKKRLGIGVLRGRPNLNCANMIT